MFTVHIINLVSCSRYHSDSHNTRMIYTRAFSYNWFGL